MFHFEVFFPNASFLVVQISHRKAVFLSIWRSLFFHKQNHIKRKCPNLDTEPWVNWIHALLACVEENWWMWIALLLVSFPRRGSRVVGRISMVLNCVHRTWIGSLPPWVHDAARGKTPLKTYAKDGGCIKGRGLCLKEERDRCGQWWISSPLCPFGVKPVDCKPSENVLKN